MTTAQVVEMSVTNNSLSVGYSHPHDRTRQITDTPGFKLFTILNSQMNKEETSKQRQRNLKKPEER